MKKKATNVNAQNLNLKNRIWRYRVLYIMVLIPMISVFIFSYIPMYGITLAFKEYSSKAGIFGSEWVGFKYFIKYFNHPFFWKLIVNSLRINFVDLVFFPAPIIFALMLNEMRFAKIKKVSQLLTYAPHFISTTIICSLVQLFLNSGGLFEVLANKFGFEYTNFLQIHTAFPWVVAITGVWKGLGWGTIIYLAALSGVSPELIEAAKIDGANRFHVIWHINIPQIVPTIITLLILRMGSMMSTGFENIKLLQNPMNMEYSNVIATYVYEIGLVGQQYSYSTAIGLFNNIISIIMISVANWISRKVSETSLW